MSYLKRLSTRRAPQSAPIPGTAQVPNSAGGFAWAVDDWARLRRFLILGSEGGSYYASRVEADARERRGGRALPRAPTARARSREIVAVSDDGPRAEERPGAVRAGDGGRRSATRRRARRRSTRCRGCAAPARTCSSSRRSSRASAAGAARCGARSALVRRRSRRRRARLPGGQVPPARGRVAPRPAAPGAPGGARQRGQPDARAVATSTRGCSSGSSAAARPTACRALVEGFARAQAARDAGARRRRSSASTACRARRCRAEHLTSPEVWEALLEDMPMTALDPQPGDDDARRPARAGLGTARRRSSRSSATRSGIRQARVHPIAVLVALRTYAAGHGGAAGSSGRRSAQIVDALDAAFYTAFENVEPTGKRMLLALDVSGSMACGCGRRRAGPDAARCLGGAGAGDGGDRAALRDRRLLRRQAAAGRPARAALDCGDGRPDAAGDQPAAAPGRRRADGVATCRSAARTARCRCCTRSSAEREIDTFVVYTDRETWAGDVHPAQALARLPARVGHRRPAGRGRHGLERLHDRRPGRPGHARRRRFRHRDAAAHLRLRPRRALTEHVAGRRRLPPTCAGGSGRMRPRRLDRRGRRDRTCGCSPTRQTHRSQTPVSGGSTPSIRTSPP